MSEDDKHDRHTPPIPSIDDIDGEIDTIFDIEDVNPNTEINEILDKLNKNVISITITKAIPVKLAEFNYAKIEHQFKIGVKNKTTDEIDNLVNLTSRLIDLMNKKGKITLLTEQVDSRF